MEEKKYMNAHDEICEKAVLNTMLQYNEAYYESHLSEGMFYQRETNAIFLAIKKLADNGKPFTLTTVAAELSKEGRAECVPYLTDCCLSTATLSDFEVNCNRLRDMWKRRKLHSIALRIQQSALNEGACVNEIIGTAIHEISEAQNENEDNILDMKGALKSLSKKVEENLKGKSSGVLTGFNYFDREGGFQDGEFVVMAAATSQGKTSLALDMCVNASTMGYPSAYYSTEMSNEKLAARIIGKRCSVPPKTIIRLPLNDEQLREFDKTLGELEDVPIYFDDTATMTVDGIISSIRKVTKRKGVKIAFVDYLQVLQTNQRLTNQTEEQFFGTTSRRLQRLAKELNVCIVLLSQLHRDREDSVPNLNKLRGSGQIAEAADTVILIYRPEVYGRRYEGINANISPKGTALIKIAKGRDTGTGEFMCGFDGEHTKFYELGTKPVTDIERPF